MKIKNKKTHAIRHFCYRGKTDNKHPNNQICNMSGGKNKIALRALGRPVGVVAILYREVLSYEVMTEPSPTESQRECTPGEYLWEHIPGRRSSACKRLEHF